MQTQERQGLDGLVKCLPSGHKLGMGSGLAFGMQDLQQAPLRYPSYSLNRHCSFGHGFVVQLSVPLLHSHFVQASALKLSPCSS